MRLAFAALAHRRLAAGFLRRAASRPGARRRRPSDGRSNSFRARAARPARRPTPTSTRSPAQRRARARFRRRLLGPAGLEGHVRQAGIHRAPIRLRPRAWARRASIPRRSSSTAASTASAPRPGEMSALMRAGRPRRRRARRSPSSAGAATSAPGVAAGRRRRLARALRPAPSRGRGARGENAGRTLAHKTRARVGAPRPLERGGRDLALPRRQRPGLADAVLVQAPGAGPILAAAKG